jgi:hypothetical protein
MDRLKAQRTPLHPIGLARSPSCVGNRAAQAHALRNAGRGIEATDGGALHRSTAMRRRDKTLPLLNEFVARAGPVHLPSVACPPESDTKEHNDYKAKVCGRSLEAQSRPHAVGVQVILASTDSSLKAGMLRILKARIDHIVHYSSVYDAAMRRHRREVRSRRTAPPTKKAHVTPAGRKVAQKVVISNLKTKHTASELAAMGGTAETPPVLRPKQSKYVVKVTFDARKISKTKAQTKVMLLLIPEGEEGQFYCQSALRIGPCSFIRARMARSSCRPT